MSGITHQMRACLTCIEEMTVDGVPPSYDEIQDAVGLGNKSRVFRLINSLEERGYIRRIPHVARSIEIIHRERADLKSMLTAELLNMRARIEAELVTRATT